MIKPGDRIRILKDFAQHTEELTGTVLTVKEVYTDQLGFTTTVKRSSACEWWYLNFEGFARGDFEIYNPKPHWERMAELVDANYENRKGSW